MYASHHFLTLLLSIVPLAVAVPNQCPDGCRERPVWLIPAMELHIIAFVYSFGIPVVHNGWIVGLGLFIRRYYVPPSGKRLRSRVDIQKYLLEHPEYIRNGVNIAQFSFRIPKSLQDNYVRKRTARTTNLYDGTTSELSTVPFEGPPNRRELEFRGPGFLTPYSELSICHPRVEVEEPPAKKKAVKPRTESKSLQSMYH